MAIKTNYVLGFLFTNDRYAVVLIRKQHPEWQAGKLNGIGGKINPLEMPVDAMVREFKEETGAETEKVIWREFCEMSGDDFVVYCFTANDSIAFEKASTQTCEFIDKVSLYRLDDEELVSNVPWLVALALDGNDGKPIYATVRYSYPFQLRPFIPTA
jgi:8-oxo-dGTP diphosphatase